MIHPLAKLFEQFKKERVYLKSVTPRTIVWYEVAFKNYRASLPPEAESLPTKGSLQQFVIHERDRGIRPVTVNTYIAVMNRFCRWLYEEQHIPERIKLRKLRVEQRVLNLLDERQIRSLVTYKPYGISMRRMPVPARTATKASSPVKG